MAAPFADHPGGQRLVVKDDELRVEDPLDEFLPDPGEGCEAGYAFAVPPRVRRKLPGGRSRFADAEAMDQKDVAEQLGVG